jgi:DNA-binding MarR family transcriptional regulator
MSSELLSPKELRIWHAFRSMSGDVLGRVGRDLIKATGLSGAEFGVLSRLASLGKGEMRQQDLADCMGWDKSRLSHQLTRMQERGFIDRQRADKHGIVVKLAEQGKKTLKAAMPIHAASVRKHLLSRLSTEQVTTMVGISNLLGDDD